jgi:hypothetical protein
MLEAVMNAYAVSYPSLQRRLIANRRSRALFLPRTTQQVRRVARISAHHPRARRTYLPRAHRASVPTEIARAALALTAVAAWAAAVYLLAA